MAKCSRCAYRGPQSSFLRKKNLAFLKTCHECTRGLLEKCAIQQETCHANLETPTVKKRTGLRPHESGQRLTLSWLETRKLLTEHKKEAFTLNVVLNLEQSDILEAIADLDDTHSEPDSVNGIIARKIAMETWEATGYRFMYVTHLKHHSINKLNINTATSKA